MKRFQELTPCRRLRAAALGALALALAGGAAAQSGRVTVVNGDYIAAVVNQELVTAGEVERRMEQARANASRAGVRVPPDAELRKQVFDALIEERVIITSARESGIRVDDAELDRAMQTIAAQNQITVAAMRERLRSEGMDIARFRANLRDQILMERLRERDVYLRIRVSDEEVAAYLKQQRGVQPADAELNLAQILVTVPEGADPATLKARQALAEAALARVKAGEDFAAVAKAVSEDGNRERGGEMGLRPASRLPDLFVDAVKDVPAGQFTAQLVRSGAGFHVLKVLERRDSGALGKVTQTKVRHVLLRTSAELSAEVASKRLEQYRQDILAGRQTFEDVARKYSEDGSASNGGDLGWATPGMMVPEFENAMNALQPGGLSAPVISRFGVHLVQVLERREADVDAKQVREQARNVLREQKFEQAHSDWAKELRSRAYVELREPPQ